MNGLHVRLRCRVHGRVLVECGRPSDDKLAGELDCPGESCARGKFEFVASGLALDHASALRLAVAALTRDGALPLGACDCLNCRTFTAGVVLEALGIRA